jgi:ribosomal protein S18 acetylase RimI-like enzyme
VREALGTVEVGTHAWAHRLGVVGKHRGHDLGLWVSMAFFLFRLGFEEKLLSEVLIGVG